MSDHGQAQMLPHHMANQSIPEKFDHGETLVDDLIRVPLLVVSPGNLEPRKIAQATSLVDLLRALLAAHPGPRLRLSSLEGNEATPELMALMAGEPRFIGRMASSAAVWMRAKIGRALEGGRTAADAERAHTSHFQSFQPTGSYAARLWRRSKCRRSSGPNQDFQRL
jgi:arylsulfatase A-like enzyme